MQNKTKPRSYLMGYTVHDWCLFWRYDMLSKPLDKIGYCKSHIILGFMVNKHQFQELLAKKKKQITYIKAMVI